MRDTECTVQGCTNRPRAKSLCSKHYDKALLEMAGPCSIKDCNNPAIRKGFCNTHYRYELHKRNPPCSVDGCNRPQVGKGICDMHRNRLSRHGSLDLIPRKVKKDYANHGLYGIWRAHAKKSKAGIVEEWMDFDTFVKGVSPVPKQKTTLLKINNKEKLGPNNYEWHKSICSKDRATYAKAYRELHPRKVYNTYLKSTYGITADEYDLMVKQQNNKCAICNRSETVVGSDGKLRSLAIDHCHDRKFVRGLLCGKCNMALGAFSDDPTIVQKAVDYLRKHGLE